MLPHTPKGGGSINAKLLITVALMPVAYVLGIILAAILMFGGDGGSEQVPAPIAAIPPAQTPIKAVPPPPAPRIVPPPPLQTPQITPPWPAPLYSRTWKETPKKSAGGYPTGKRRGCACNIRCASRF
jgi:hypothetical protein